MNTPGCRPPKRQRSEANTHDIEEEPTSKRRKTFASGYSPGFWNKLSKVKLTRRALKEFDQRTSSNRSEIPAPRRPTQGSTNRRLLRSTTKRLKQIADQGGPDLSRLRGYAEVPRNDANMSQSSGRSRKRSNSSASGSRAAKTKTTTPYSAEFEQKMIDVGVYPEGYRMGDRRAPKPENHEQLRQMLSNPRASLSPSIFTEGDFEDFQDLNRTATSESKGMAKVFPIIAGSKDKHFSSAENISFNHLDKFEKDLSTPKPDIYYGAQPSQIDRRVRRELQASIVPSSRQSLPAAPNFFVEGKSASGRPDVAQRQAMYDGAVGARGVHQLQNYGGSATVYDGNAYTLTATYSDGQMKMYATHPRESESRPGETEYYMTQLRAFAMTDTSDNFRAGTAAFRNGREWARDQRDSHIANANATVQTASPNTTMTSGNRSTLTSFTIDEDSGESETSPDELGLPGPAKRHKSSTSGRLVSSKDSFLRRSGAS